MKRILLACVALAPGLLGGCAQQAPRAPEPPKAAHPEGGVGVAESSSSTPPKPPLPTAVWSSFTAPGGEKPVISCKPDAKTEQCLDGIDNNCDGQLDEGCSGYRTQGNLLQLTLAWKLGVDLELRVVAPDGAEIARDKTCSGVIKGVDDCPDGKIENAAIPEGREVPKGRYLVEVTLADARGRTEAQVPAFLGGKVGAQTFFVPMFVANKKGERKTFQLEIE